MPTSEQQHTIASENQEVEIKRIALKYVNFVTIKCLLHTALKNQEDKIEYFALKCIKCNINL